MRSLEHVVIWERDVTGRQVNLELHDNATVGVSAREGRHRAYISQGGAWEEGDGVYLVPKQSGYEAVVVEDGGDRLVDVTYIPEDVDLYERNVGVLDTDDLRKSHVLIIGLGSGGSAILRELVRCGVGRFTLVDHDRMMPGNVSRHELGLKDVGRFKVRALRDYVLERNPFARIDAIPEAVTGDNLVDLYAYFRNDMPEVVVCGTDSRQSRLLVNRLAVQLGTYTLFGGVRRGAFAGDVLQVVPGVTPCYQCFVRTLPLSVESNVSALSGGAPSYWDGSEMPEPGLSIDIGPVALLMAKLALTELLRGRTRRFDMLSEDLVAPAFFWLSRREPGTNYEYWPPLRDSAGEGPRILQWLGRWFEKDEQCSVCA
jgi:molybdopterin/thiamine biosynthesis adenylyltransferase